MIKAEKALQLAQEKGLDLVEIAPMAKPPVARIINFDKFRYQEDRKEKKQRQAQKIKELKRIRISPRAAQNDLQTKVNKIDKFLNDGHKVEVNLFLRGRENKNKEWGLQKLKEFLEMIQTPHQVTMEPRRGHRGFITQIAKK